MNVRETLVNLAKLKCLGKIQCAWTVQQEVNTHGQSVEALGAVAQPCPHRNASADKLTQASGK